MTKSRTRALGTILALTLALCMLASCAGAPPAQTTEPSASAAATPTPAASAAASVAPSEPPEDDGTIKWEATGESYTRNADGYPQLGGTELTIWLPRGWWEGKIDDFNTFWSVQELQRLMDVKFTFIHPPGAQVKENFAMVIASDTLPDIMFYQYNGSVNMLYPGGTSAAIDDDLVLDVTPFINEVNTPNFKRAILDDEYNATGAYDDKGRIVKFGAQVNGSEENHAASFALGIREDLFNATGLPLPVTIDDWTAMMAKLKEQGVKYPFVADNVLMFKVRNAFSNAYGFQTQGYGIMPDKKTVYYAPFAPGYKDFLAKLNEWFEAGYINPDFPTQDKTTTFSMIGDGLGAMVALHFSHYNTEYYQPIESKDPTKKLVFIDVPVLNVGDKVRNTVGERGIGDPRDITTDCKTPLAAVLMLDALYRDDVRKFVNLGQEGVGWNIGDNGFPMTVLYDGTEPVEFLASMGIGEFGTGYQTSMEETLASNWAKGIPQQAIPIMNKHAYDGNFPSFAVMPTEDQAFAGVHQVDVTTYFDEMFLKFIMGVEPLDNFDAFLARLNELKAGELTANRQKAYDAYLARSKR